MKKVLFVLTLVPFLFGCASKQDNNPKIKIQRVNEGKMVVVNAKHMFDEAFSSKINSIYYIGDDTCSSCKQLKPSLEAWCKANYAYIYEIKYQDIDEEGFSYLQQATVGYYSWSENSSVPTVYFFMGGEVVMKGSSDNTMNILTKYIEVVSE